MELQAKPASELEASIKEGEKKIEDLEEGFKTMLEGLQNQYKEASDKKDADIAAIKQAGLGLMKSILKAKEASNEEL